jgi:hypothetical protein
MTEEDSKLVLRAEKLVAELPLREPDWETLANRVEKEALLPPATDESLFVAPTLEAEPGEGAESDAPVLSPESIPPPPLSPRLEPAVAAFADAAAASQREPVSLADLARATVAKRGAAESASIAKASLDLAVQRRNQGGEVAERAQQAARSGRQAITLPPARPARSGDQRGIWVGVGIAAIGLAAGFGLYLTAERERETIIVAGAPGVAALPEAAPPRASPAEPSTAAGRGSEPVVDAPRGVSLDALEREAAAAKSPAPAVAPGAVAPGGRLATAPAPAGVAGAGVKPERVILEEDRLRDPVPPAQLAARAAGSSGLKPAELGRDSGSADRPSAGAAQAAVGSVLGAARSCIAGHPRPSSATIVFGSNGEVSQVAVGGEAAGTPAAGCIESALKKARVQPFAAPTFSLAVTVRPP